MFLKGHRQSRSNSEPRVEGDPDPEKLPNSHLTHDGQAGWSRMEIRIFGASLAEILPIMLLMKLRSLCLEDIH